MILQSATESSFLLKQTHITHNPQRVVSFSDSESSIHPFSPAYPGSGRRGNSLNWLLSVEKQWLSSKLFLGGLAPHPKGLPLN